MAAAAGMVASLVDSGGGSMRACVGGCVADPEEVDAQPTPAVEEEWLVPAGLPCALCFVVRAPHATPPSVEPRPAGPRPNHPPGPVLPPGGGPLRRPPCHSPRGPWLAGGGHGARAGIDVPRVINRNGWRTATRGRRTRDAAVGCRYGRRGWRDRVYYLANSNWE